MSKFENKFLSTKMGRTETSANLVFDCIELLESTHHEQDANRLRSTVRVVRHALETALQTLQAQHA